MALHSNKPGSVQGPSEMSGIECKSARCKINACPSTLTVLSPSPFTPQILFGDLGHTQWYIGVTPESAQGTICNAQD